MSKSISVTGLSKQYVLGSESIAGQSFREMLLGSLTAPLKKIRRLRGADAAQERFWALKDISFEAEQGEVIGVIGRNGAGKSTLLKILSRITTPTHGRIHYRGRLASLLEVGTGFHPELTGRENIYLNGAILGMSRQEIDQRMADIVAFAEIEKFLDTPVKRYSSGMYVRLAFSVAAHMEPDILIIDEVLAVGDLNFQQKCLGKLKDVAGEGRTVLFVSHNLSAVKNLCSRILYIEGGKIAADGIPEQVIQQYLATNSSNEAVWRDHDNEYQYLADVSLMKADQQISGVIQFNEITLVRIKLKKPSTLGTIVAVRATDVFGNIIFTSWDKDSLSREHDLEANTAFRQCTIPAELLKPGAYTLTVFARAFGEDGRPILEEANLTLSVSAEQCPIDEGRLGLIAPLLEWRTTPN